MTVGIGLMIASLFIAIIGLVALFVEEDAAAIGLFVIALLVFLFGGIWETVDELNDPEHGVITQKEFRPRHMVCSKGCFYVPDKWYFVIDDHGNIGDVEVQHSTYNNKKVGDYFGGSKD